jgi:serine/threonine protein phosphatase 1
VAGVRDQDQLVSVGDLIDRGPRPFAVIELFRARPHSRVLMGNHEQVFCGNTTIGFRPKSGA